MTPAFSAGDSGEPQHIRLLMDEVSAASKRGASRMRWNCSGTMAEWVTPCSATAASQPSASKCGITTTVPPESKVQPMPAHEMFENRPSEHRFTAARS